MFRCSIGEFINYYARARVLSSGYQWAKMAQQSNNSASQLSSAKDHSHLTIHLRDINAGMVKAWEKAFKDKKYSKFIKASILISY